MDIPMTPFLVASPMNGLPTPVLAPCWLSSGSLWDAGHSDLPVVHGHEGGGGDNGDNCNNWLVVSTPLKNRSSSDGMMKFPIYGKIKLMFQTTNQISIVHRLGPSNGS
jgi:hypothetical protein